MGHLNGLQGVQGFNRYAYVNNNPYKYTDPSGEFAFLIPVAIFLVKEIAAEVASRATGGATDFLSARRMATKGVKQIIKSTKELRGGSFNQSKKEVINDANGVCSYCQNAPATQGGHAKTLNSFKADVNEGKMTATDAKAVANSKDNIVASCAQCNQVDKHTKDLGTGPGQYNPPNPDERVKGMLENK